MFRCLCTRELIYCVCLSYKILKLYKRAGRCMVKSVLLVKCGSDCKCNLKSCFGVCGALVGNKLKPDIQKQEF